MTKDAGGAPRSEISKRMRRAFRAVQRRVDRATGRLEGVRCPICDRQARRFLTHEPSGRKNARCPRCKSLERHRLTWEFLRSRTDLLDGAPKRMLHFAPEPALERTLRAAPGLTRITGDLSLGEVSVRLDLLRLPFRDATFDVVYASHVFEHVVDDVAAMRECARVLRPGGWALFLVPVRLGPTDEDPNVTDAAERRRRFGQEDHFRIYGPDVVDRLRLAGFDVRVFTTRDVVGASAHEMGVQGARTGPLFLCRRRSR